MTRMVCSVIFDSSGHSRTSSVACEIHGVGDIGQVKSDNRPAPNLLPSASQAGFFDLIISPPRGGPMALAGREERAGQTGASVNRSIAGTCFLLRARV